VKKLIVLTLAVFGLWTSTAQAVGLKLTAPTPGLKIVQLREFIAHDKYVLTHPYQVRPIEFLEWEQLVRVYISQKQRDDARAHMAWSERLLSHLWPQLGNVSAWMCIHHYEGSWTDTGDPYWGGLQMDSSFMRTYGSDMVTAYGGRWADAWHPYDQIIVAERARRSGRGYYPWPKTARYCGLI
jgi:hypothetical protein